VKNNTNSDIEVLVNHLDHYQNDTLQIEIKYIVRLIQKCKGTTRFELNKKLFAERLDDENYKIKFPAESTSLLEPMTMGIPVKRIIIQNSNKVDTIIFERTNPNWRGLMEKGIVTKRGFSVFTIEFNN
jgi:hypothetical protein